MSKIKTSGFHQPATGQLQPHPIQHTAFEPVDEEPIATLLILHGMQEHSGRYAHFAKHLASQGFAVLTYDHLGHGKTAKGEKSLGFFSRNQPVKQVLDDVLVMEEYLEGLYPGKPRFILGHSMGSFIERCFLQSHWNRLKGAVIVGTGGRVPASGLGKFFFQLANFISPQRRSAFVNNTFSRQNNSRFKREDGGGQTSWLSVNKENRISFENDPLNGVPFSNNGFFTLLSLVNQATKRNWSENISAAFPMLFVSGQDDPIGNFGKGVQQTVDNLEKDGFKDVSIKLYPGMRHEILNEDVKEDVYAEITRWLKSKM